MNKKMFSTVQSDLELLEEELLSVIHSPVDLITDISNHLVQAGGKRLRPALYLICARDGNGTLADIMPMAISIELIHMATLVHDDVIDNAMTRRGRPTANAQWNNQLPVLTGDYLFAKAFSLVATHVDSIRLKVLTDVICSMCEGEIIQNRDSFNPGQSEPEYLVRIAKKTADFIAASCELGGLSAGLAAENVQAVREYGYDIGMAFQITDDILDVTASSEQLGKPAGNDLRQGIITLPVIYALEKSPDKEELRNILITRDMPEDMVKRGLTIIHATEAVEYSYSRVADYLAKARQVLPKALTDDTRQSLLAVADFVGLRKY
ncbi:MAG: polyprenyl synthetase family protein [Veillonellales bacterium]